MKSKSNVHGAHHKVGSFYLGYLVGFAIQSLPLRLADQTALYKYVCFPICGPSNTVNTGQISHLIKSNNSSLKEKMWKLKTWSISHLCCTTHNQRLVFHLIPTSKSRVNFKVKMKKCQVVKTECRMHLWWRKNGGGEEIQR